jgi:chitodextrinase
MKLRAGVLAVLALLAVSAEPASAKPARFLVGAATRSIAPNVPIYAGGFGIGAPISTVRDPASNPLEVRAMVISNGKRAVAFVVADVQAFFPAYQEGPQFGTAAIRSQAAEQIAAAAHVQMSADDVIVQGSYTHSGATLEGLWGPVPLPYLELVHQRAVEALVAAAADMRPARLQAATVHVPELLDTRLNQGGEYAGWAVDDQLSVLRAVEPRSRATIATFFNVPAHPDIVNGARLHILGDDYLGEARSRLDSRLGGVSIGSTATVGRQEAPVQTTVPEEAAWYGNAVANAVTEGLGDASWVTSSRLGGADRIVEVPGTNAALLAMNEAWHGTPDQRQQVAGATGIYPIDRLDQPPYLTGNVIGTPVTALRIGRLLYLSMPGEPFPEIRQTIAADTKGADAIVALSKGQDDLAYFYPAPIYPVTIAWGSDHYEYNVAPQAGDQIIQGQEQNLAALGFQTGPGIAVPGNNDYQQALLPGLQVLASPRSGDAGPDGSFTTSLQAIFSPAHTGGSPIAGKVHWDLGDGTTANTRALKDGTSPDPAWFDHAYQPGMWKVTASATDQAGHVATAQLAVDVYPQLIAAIEVVSRAGQDVVYRGGATGGHGRLLAWHWRFGDGTSAEGRTVEHTFPAGTTPQATLTVTDATGSSATTSL